MQRLILFMFYVHCLMTVCLLFRRMPHPYPRQCPAPSCFHLAVSELAFRRHLVLHHHVELEFQDGREEFRRMSSPEGERRARAIRGRRRGRQCQRQMEAAARRRSIERSPEDRSPGRPTPYRPAGCSESSSSSSDEADFDTSLPEDMDQLPELSFVGRVSSQPPRPAGASSLVPPPSAASRLPPEGIPQRSMTQGVVCHPAACDVRPLTPPPPSPPRFVDAACDAQPLPPRVATPPEVVDAACDARPLTPPPPPPPPQIVEVLEIQHSTLERPDMTPQQLAASLAAIINVFPRDPPAATVDRFVGTLPGLVTAPQRETMLFAATYAAELHRELCRYLLQDFENHFGQLDRLDINTAVALVRFLLENLSMWHDRPLFRRL